jgi:hypothetical protein
METSWSSSEMKAAAAHSGDRRLGQGVELVDPDGLEPWMVSPHDLEGNGVGILN